MSTPNNHPLTRRHWMGMVAVPTIAASLGSSPLATAQTAAPAIPDAAAAALGGARIHNVRTYGAKGDGVTLDTAAVQAAIDACTADRGGVVLVPAGDFVVGTLELKSNVTLRLAAQGRLLGSDKIEHYRAGRDIPPGNGNIVLLSAANAENITIEGPGTIDGNGAKFFTGRGDATGPGENRAQGYYQRPHLLIWYQCKNIVVRDVFLTASAYHGMRVLHCEQVRCTGVRIYNRVNKNNDGFHFNSCRYVHVSDCEVRCQDDACALFGSCRFVTVTNCTFSTRWSIFRFGGGDPEDIAISNCVIYQTYGCPIKMAFGRDSRAQNITFSNLIMHEVTGPIAIGFSTRSRRRSATASNDASPQGYVRNLSFHGIRATVVDNVRQHADIPFPFVSRDEVRSCLTLNGTGPEATLENISLSDIHVTYEGGGTADEAKREIPLIAGEYFEIGTPPAYGIYARHVRGLSLQNIRLETTKPDLRPAVVFDRVADAAVHGLSAQSHPSAASVLRLTQTQDTLLTACRVTSPAAAFLQVDGADTAGITVDGGDLAKAAKPLAGKDPTAEKAVKLRV